MSAVPIVRCVPYLRMLRNSAPLPATRTHGVAQP